MNSPSQEVAFSLSETEPLNVEKLDFDKDNDLSLREIWNLIQAKDDVILTINCSDELKIRRGLSNLKAKQNKKFKEEGLPVDDTTLEFETKQTVEQELLCQCTLRCWLVKNETITVYRITLPEQYW